jgi:hypothetical protein
MKFIALGFLLLTFAFPVRAADGETDCRDYDGGFHAEAMRLKMLESKNASRDKATPVSRDGSPAPAAAGDRSSEGNQAAGKEK